MIFGAAAILLFVGAGFVLFFSLSNASKSDSVDGFSQERAESFLSEIAREPAPVGSENHLRVRNKIIETIDANGLQAETQNATVVSQFPERNIFSANITNIYCKLKGSNGDGNAVLFVAHYDTVANSPGASDNGSSVAAYLETIRILKSRPPLSNDVIFLFTDAEELGLLGAKAFVDAKIFSEDIKVVINFDSRGNSGVVNMFQTSSGNYRLIKELSSQNTLEHANSFNSEIYKLLNNNSDLTVFLKTPAAALNFANIDGVSAYHNRTDNAQNIDRGLIAAKTEQAFELADHLGKANLYDLKSDEDIIYFDLLGWQLIAYSQNTAFLLTAFTGILLMLYIFRQFRAEKLRLKYLAVSIFLCVSVFILNSLVPGALWFVIKSLQSVLNLSIQDDIYFSKIYFAGFLLLEIAIIVWIYGRFGQKTNFENLQTGILICFFILSTASLFTIPGVSFIFTWSLLVSTLFSFYLANENQKLIPTLAFVFLSALICLPLLPLTYQIHIALGIDNIYISSVFPTIILLFQIPLITMASQRNFVKISALFLVGAIVLIGAGIFNFGFNEVRPKADHLFYVANTDLKKALWVSADEMTDERTRDFFGENSKRGSVDDYALLGYGNYLMAEAGFTELPQSKITKTCDIVSDGFRTLCLQIETPNNGIKIGIPQTDKATVYSTKIDDEQIVHDKSADKEEPFHWAMEFWNASERKISVELKIKTEEPVSLKIIEFRYGLPEISPANKPRSPTTMPSQYSYSNMTLISRTEEF